MTEFHVHSDPTPVSTSLHQYPSPVSFPPSILPLWQALFTFSFFFSFYPPFRHCVLQYCLVYLKKGFNVYVERSLGKNFCDMYNIWKYMEKLIFLRMMYTI